MREISNLEKERLKYQPKLPPNLTGGISGVSLSMGDATSPKADAEAIRKRFPHTCGLPVVEYTTSEEKVSFPALRAGVILSGGQAPGGHNVIAGIFDGIKNANPDSILYGFLGGPSGLESGKFRELTTDIINSHRNTGGFDIIGSGRTKLETPEQFDRCISVMQRLDLNAVVIIGGDDSNTNAAVLAEYLLEKNVKTAVIGVPKTIDGDLKNEHIPTSFGFDTAVKIYAELVGNIARDASSAKKYWHFIKLMGRSASHIALEVGLQTRPNVTLISEEVAANQWDLHEVVEQICDSIVTRAEDGKDYGLVLVPEGLIEFMPNMKNLIASLNDILAEHDEELAPLSTEEKVERLSQWLEADAFKTLQFLPERLQAQLFLDRDPHGNVQVSRIETEALLIELVSRRLDELKKEGKYSGSFSEQHHFFGYEGRCASPSNFDADYTYSLGYGASVLIANGKTGYMSCVQNLAQSAAGWKAAGIPITMLFNMEQRHGKPKPVIQKALVDLEGAPFQFLNDHRRTWAREDSFVYPGPIQYFGPSSVSERANLTLELEQAVPA